MPMRARRGTIATRQAHFRRTAANGPGAAFSYRPVLTEPMPELLYLIDVSSLVFQVFHAIPEMTSPHGLPTNAVFGFTRDMLNILRQKQPTHLLCATDPSGPGERENLYPQYKANRSAMPDELAPQFPMVARTIVAFGIPVLEVSGWEADDVIATVVAAA